MEILEERFRPILITKGRKTGNPHSVWLRAVKYNKKIYFFKTSSRRGLVSKCNCKF